MKSLYKIFMILSLCLFCVFHSKAQDTGRKTVFPTPAFKEQGKIIDSLRSIYHFESVEYENWEKDDATDSCLTVCFINSQRLPATGFAAIREFKAIASGIHRSLVDTSRYKMYYIIFVTSNKSGTINSKVHTAGMEVLVNEL